MQLSTAADVDHQLIPLRCGCVAQVEVTDIAAGKTWYFAGKFWLDAAQGDGLTERLLTASDKDPHADMVTYKVGVADASVMFFKDHGLLVAASPIQHSTAHPLGLSFLLDNATIITAPDSAARCVDSMLPCR